MHVRNQGATHRGGTHTTASSAEPWLPFPAITPAYTLAACIRLPAGCCHTRLPTAALADLAPGPLTPAQQQEQVGRVVEGVLGLPPGRLDEGMYTQAARAAAIAGDAAQVGCACVRQCRTTLSAGHCAVPHCIDPQHNPLVG